MTYFSLRQQRIKAVAIQDVRFKEVGLRTITKGGQSKSYFNRERQTNTE